MTTAYEIPLTASSQTFSVALAGVTYLITQRWNSVALCWVIDIADSLESPIVSGIPLVTGTNLLGQYEYLGIGGALVVQTDSSVDDIPTSTNLGTDSHLYFVVD